MFVNLIILACSVFVFTEAAFVDTLGKCSIYDDKCLQNTYGSVIKGIGHTGISEFGIPPIDPMTLKEISISIADLVKITLVDGTASGITGCRFNKFHMDIKKERGQTELVCSLTIAGKYTVFSASPIIKTLLNGSAIHGEGNGKVLLDKLVLKMDFPFYAQKRDGNIFLKFDFKSAKYDYDVLGKVQFEADNLYLGEQEASKTIVGMLNANWKFVMSSVGRDVVNKAMDIFSESSSKFFDVVAAKSYITEDLTPYAKP